MAPGPAIGFIAPISLNARMLPRSARSGTAGHRIVAQREPAAGPSRTHALRAVGEPTGKTVRMDHRHESTAVDRTTEPGAGGAVG